VLLHCCTNPERHHYIENLLHGFTFNNDGSDRVLAIINIWDGEKEVEIKFLVGDYPIEDIAVDLDDEYHNRNGIHPPVLREEHIIYICSYFLSVGMGENRLLCRVSGNLYRYQAKNLLDEISNKIFLAAPITQVFLFISRESRYRLFAKNGGGNYDSDLKLSKSKLPGFFTYDFAPVDLLIKVFTSVRDEDFRTAIETEGEYGKRYKELLAELNLLLANKKVNISTDFSKITFKLDTNNENIELYPEDLSHGELKRLTIYLWIKYNKIEDAIVLMDEIEIGFHPDWQYRIIPDLEQWSPSNQYILATHSYELCQALTPGHVRELEPKLIKSDKNISL
jgi:hypothetical protein